MARSAFWTIIVNDQPTAFRAPLREDLLPTLKQLQRQHPDAAIKWFQRGRLWETPGDAMDASKPPRRGSSWRPGGTHKDPREQYKVPRDVKRARWARQASEGRGPWVKDGRSTDGGPKDGGSRGQGAGAGRRPESRDSGRPPRGTAGTQDRRNSGPRDGGRPAQDARRPREEQGGAGRGRASTFAPRATADGRPARPERREFKPEAKRPVDGSSFRVRKPATGPDGAERRKNWPPKDARGASGTRPPNPAWGPKAGGDRPRPAGGARQDWRGDRSTTRRDATARSGGAPSSRERTGPPRERTGPPPERKTRTWRAGELPPADRKRRKPEE